MLAFCGLGQPESFRHSLETLEVELVGLKPFKDHRVYQEKDKHRLLSAVAP